MKRYYYALLDKLDTTYPVFIVASKKIVPKRTFKAFNESARLINNQEVTNFRVRAQEWLDKNPDEVEEIKVAYKKLYPKRDTVPIFVFERTYSYYTGDNLSPRDKWTILKKSLEDLGCEVIETQFEERSKRGFILDVEV